jgi:hypothetical protein
MNVLEHLRQILLDVCLAFEEAGLVEKAARYRELAEKIPPSDGRIQNYKHGVITLGLAIQECRQICQEQHLKEIEAMIVTETNRRRNPNGSSKTPH